MDNRIKELRKAHKLNQTELGNAIGISASAIGMYEQGRRDPDTNTLLKIAKYFDVSVDYLINASELKERFDIDAISKSVAKNLIEQPALMFSASCYTEQELEELSIIIENSVKVAITEKLNTSN